MKRAIIVGASSGIGKELAQLLTDDHCIVGITGRRRDLLRKMARVYPGKIFYQPFDIAQSNNFKMLRRLVKKMGGLDMLIFCAGCEAKNPKLEIDKERTSIATNVNGFVEVVNWAINYFIIQGHGQLIAISSIAGLRGGRIAPSYNAAKAFQMNYLEGLRQKVNKLMLPVHITDIRPGFIDTDLANKDVMFWEISAKKAARLILQTIKRKVAIAYIPFRWWIFVILLRIIPGTIFKKL